MVGTIEDIYQGKRGFVGLNEEQKQARYDYLINKAMPFSISRGYYSPLERYSKSNPHFIELVKLGKELNEEIYDLSGASKYFIEKDFRNKEIKRPILFIDYLKKKGLIKEEKRKRTGKTKIINKIKEIKDKKLTKYEEREEKQKQNLLKVKEFKKEKCQPLKNVEIKRECNKNAKETNDLIKAKLERIKKKRINFKKKTSKLNELSVDELEELLEILRRSLDE